MDAMLYDILRHFNIEVTPSVYGDGHINDTYIVHSHPDYILQRINKSVFVNPPEVMENIRGVTEFLRKKIIEEGGNPETETLNLVNTVDGKSFYHHTDGEYYRVYKFIEHADNKEGELTPAQLYQAARAFGKFTNMLADYPAEKLHETIVNFHNTRARYDQFREALAANRSGRADRAKAEIAFVLEREGDAGVIVDALAEGRIPLRVTHNDTKLNNVLMNRETGDGLCVIDLDTVMPGSLLYDYGDALRFGGSSGAEDEPDLDKIWFVRENFEAFTRGYIEALPSITAEELKLLPFSIKLMTLECGSRFLADYINGDTYFKIKPDCPEQNLIRSRTQFKLVKQIEEQMDELNAIVATIAAECRK